MRRRPGAGGFTLIEVLVALVVMAVMSLMAWRGVDGIVRTREASQQRLEQTLRLETVMAQWEADLAALQDTSAAVGSTPVVPALMCDGQSVRLTRRTEGGLQVVAWSLRPGSNGSNWQRWAGPAETTTETLKESWFSTLQFQGTETGQLRALGGLDDWQVYFFRGNAWSNCQSTGDVSAGGGAAQTTALPQGVRIVLSFGAGSGLTGQLTRDVVIAP